MASASSPLSSSLSTASSLSHLISNPHRPSHPLASSISIRSPLPSRFPSLTSLHLRLRLPPLHSLSSGSGDNGGESIGISEIGVESNVSGHNGGESNVSGEHVVGESNVSGDKVDESNGSGDNFGGGGDDGGGGHGDDESEGGEDRNEALIVLANLGRSLDSLPVDLAEAVRDGKVNGEIIMRFIDLENSPLLRWLMHFGGFRERLLADDLFLSKICLECGIGLFTKAAAEYQKRKETFFKELDIVVSDMVMAIIADFMLVWLSASTLSLRPSVVINSGPIGKLFQGCPDNAFQVALAGKSYTFMQRIGALVRNGSKLFVVGSVAQLIGTGFTNALIKARKAVDKDYVHEGEHVEFSLLGYGAYMSFSSNLRYQFLAGVIEQRMLVPLLRRHKALLKALCFAIRTGNTFLGSLLWVDYARWVGIQ